MKLRSWINRFSWAKLLYGGIAALPAPPSQPHEAEKKRRHGWVNIWKPHPTTPPRVNGFVHKSEWEAKEVARLHGQDLLVTVKVEWEE